jgi:hypothetical protein
MCRPRTKAVVRTIAAAMTLATMLAGCSDIYFDRRETIALSGGDAVAANAVAQTVDPWPPHSGSTNIAFNGQKMQSAVERYRNDKVIQPVKPTTSDVQNKQEAAAAAISSGSPSTSSTSGAAAPSGTPAQ